MFDSLNNANSDKPAQYVIARVVENNDPLQLQRVKVVVPEMLEGNTDDLPWVLPLHAHAGGFGETYGMLHVPPIGAEVVVEFQGGRASYGLLLGSVPEKRSKLDPLLANYPNRRGWVDHQGNYFYIDTTEGQNQVELYHKSGTWVKILDSGEVQVFTQSNARIDVTGNADVNVAGTTNVVSQGNMTVQSHAKLTLQGNGGIEMRAPRIDSTKI